MPPLPAELYCAQIDASTAALAVIVDSADPGLAIPACPEWTLRQLATHLGRTQRWVSEIVRTRSAELIDLRSVPDGRFPDDPAAGGLWLTAGATALIDTLRAAGDSPVWAFGPLRPASTWARRMSHEAMVHSADAAIAIGEQADMPAVLAADAVDEWLTDIGRVIAGQPDRRAEGLPAGRTLHVHVTDPDLGNASGEWLISHDDDGIHISSAHDSASNGRASNGRADVALSGPAADVLLVLVGRQPASDASVSVDGDASLLDGWLAATPF